MTTVRAETEANSIVVPVISRHFFSRLNIVKTVDESPADVVLGLRDLANVVFIVGAIASIADGLITWIVISRVGL